jgi:NhaA family Na+:H+ antiporter
MIVPALVYLAIAGGTDARGWGVPMATDIALAVGVLAVLGARVSSPLRAYLLGLAIVDDIGAIIIIAAVYSTGITWSWLAVAVMAMACTAVARSLGAHRMMLYVSIGAVAWFAMHEAGIHPTLAGVAMGLLAPAVPRVDPDLIDIEQLSDLSSVEHARNSTALARSSVSVVEWLQHLLHPWTSYVIVPVFALANSGIELSSRSLRDATTSTIAWGVLIGLVVGKPLGVIAASRIAARIGLADIPAGATGRQLLGIGNAAGIGFTVAVFIAELAFTDPVRQAEAKLSILVASVVSALFAVAVLTLGPAPSVGDDHTETTAPATSR